VVHYRAGETNNGRIMSQIAVQDVDKSFSERKVVSGVSFFVQRGEAIGLLGPSGSGKTTILQIITGIIKADRGRIEVDGEDISGMAMYQRARRGVGYLPQETSIFDDRNVDDIIRSVFDVIQVDRERHPHELDVLLEQLDITRLRKMSLNALSSGERRRVEIAQVLAARPAYMLLDEPFADIDRIAIDDMQTLIRHLARCGIGILIADNMNHNTRRTLEVSDRTYVMCSGELLGTLTT
jgi:lipopolysaccharide export system ATP-binding protein